MSTPILPFARWLSGTNQNSIPANDNVLRQEILQGIVISDSTTAQPGSPSDRDVYIIPAGATGAQWSAFDEDDLAIFYQGTWYAFAPVEGVVVHFAGDLKQWTEIDGWQSIGGSGGGGIESIVAGTNITVDNTDPLNPVVSATGGGGGGSYVGCKAYNDGQQVISSATVTAVTFNSESWDTDGIHSTSSNTSRFTVPTGLDGRWRFRWHMHVQSSSGTIVGFMRKNGGDDSTALIGSGAKVTGNTLSGITFTGEGLEDLDAGDYVELFCYFQGGGVIGQGIADERAFITTMEAQFLG